MKTEPNDQDIAKALAWYKRHREIDVAILLTNDEYPPSGSDCHKPNLWKAGHWKWLLTRDVINLIECCTAGGNHGI